MIKGLDHIVIFVDDLEWARADYEALGFTVIVGGEHAGGASHNALVVFADGTYLELIAFRHAGEPMRWWETGTTYGEGFVDYALLPDDTASVVAEAQARGLALQGPIPGGRVRTDGTPLKWQTARAASADLPFLCGDLTPRALRVPEGALREHRNGARGIAALAVLVADLQRSAERYAALLGTAATDAGPGRARFALGDVALLLVAPPDAGEQRRTLQTRGEGLFEVTLQGNAASAPFEPQRLHGARFAWAADRR